MTIEDAKKRLTTILSGEKDPLHPHDTVDKVLIDVYHAGFRNALKVMEEEKHKSRERS